MKNPGEQYRVPALERAFEILDLLRSSGYGRTVAELSKLLSLPYSTTFSLLKTMERHAFVRRDGDTKKFYCGAKLTSYLGGSSQGSDVTIRDTASSYLAQLVNKCGMTGHLAVRQGDEAIYIDRRESNGFLKINSWIGQHQPLHCTGVGKSLLLFSTPEQVVEIFRKPVLPRFTDRTITTVTNLIKHLQKCRSIGYTVDDRESELEGVCIASPIMDAQGTVVAAIGLAGTIYQLTPEKFPEIGSEVRSIGEEISRRLGFAEEFPWQCERSVA